MAKIEKDQISFSKWQDLLFSLKRGKGHQFSFWRNRFLYWDFMPKHQMLPDFPDHVDIEVSTLCNMKCPMCYTRTDIFKANVNKTFMPLELYKKIIDECASRNVFSIRLSLRGESFIHPDIIEMAWYAKKAGIKEVSSLTNLLAITPEMFEEMVKMEFDWLTISFDGLGEEYERIRKPAKFAEAYEKIQKFKRIKDEYGAVKPVIKVQAIWPSIEKNPKAFLEAMNPYVDMVASNPLSDNFGTVEYEYVDDLCCEVPYQRMLVTAEGKVPLCVNDDYELEIVGDVTKESLHSIWHGTAMTQARAQHKLKGGYKSLKCCCQCYKARAMESATEETSDGKTVEVYRFKTKD